MAVTASRKAPDIAPDGCSIGVWMFGGLRMVLPWVVLVVKRCIAPDEQAGTLHGSLYHQYIHHKCFKVLEWFDGQGNPTQV